MLEGEPDPDEKRHVPAFRTEGSIFFSGTARRSDVPYSPGTRILGYIIGAALIFFIAWFIVSFIAYQM